MDYEHWETFISLAETHSFTRTAEQLNISQTTVTNRIKQLENHIGKLLFVRDTRRVQLSEAGLKLYPYAKQGVTILKKGEFVAKSFIDFDETLGIGSLVSIWHYFLLPYVQQLKLENPNFTIRINTGHTKRMIQLLLDEVIDVCIIPYKPHHPDLEVIELFEEPFHLVGSPSALKRIDTPLTGEGLHRWQFIHIPWETPFIEWFQSEIGNSLFPSIEVDDTTIFMRFLLEQEMIGFIPKMVANQYLNNGELCVIPYEPKYELPKRSIYFVYHKRNSDLRSLSALKNLLLNNN